MPLSPHSLAAGLARDTAPAARPVAALAAPVALLLGLVSACAERRTTAAAARDDVLVLARIDYGRLVDVYGLRAHQDAWIPEPVQRDVVIAPEVWGREAPERFTPDAGAALLLVHLGRDPDTAQPRLLIQREAHGRAFAHVLAALTARLVEVPFARAVLDGSAVPDVPLVPRDAALRLTFSRELGVGDGFFVERGAGGQITGVVNPVAVQLLALHADGAPSPVAARVLPRGRTLVVDPVLTGGEGIEWSAPNRATGMPESANPIHANVRLALALEGALMLPGLRPSADQRRFVATDGAGRAALASDFRAGNERDDSAVVARGFLRSPDPLRVVAEVPVVIAAVDPPDGAVQTVVVRKHGIAHGIDRGDFLRIADPRTGAVLATTEILIDPPADRDDPAIDDVPVRVHAIPGLAARSGGELRAALLAPFDPGDDPRFAFRFGPAPPPLDDGTPSPPNQDLSPFATFAVRFSKPVDAASVQPHDTFFVATRDVLDRDAILRDFVQPRALDPECFPWAKFATPHLAASRLVDERGDATAFRLTPVHGLYLDAEMRARDASQPFGERAYRYWLHLRAGTEGVRDRNGAPLDLASARQLVVPFGLDLRHRADGRPVYGDNRVVHVVRRFAATDEDEQPSLYRHGEAPRLGVQLATNQPLQDWFGAAAWLPDGTLLGRPTSRLTRAVDDVHQPEPPPQDSVARHCPRAVGGEEQIASRTARARFAAPLANPLNPSGCRLQTVWREVDLGLSRLDAQDFDLDVERMYWAPFEDDAVRHDRLDRTSLFLGHSEQRPEPCVGGFSGLPTLPNSGLGRGFADNYVHNPARGLLDEAERTEPHPAYLDEPLVIDPHLAVTGPSGFKTFLPFPELEQPLFAWRDQRLMLQGGNSGAGSDQPGSRRTFDPYIVSPWRGGLGRGFVERSDGAIERVDAFWSNTGEFSFAPPALRDPFTGGGLASIALPLLADFQVLPNPGVPPTPPVGSGGQYRGPGDVLGPGFPGAGWQVSLGSTRSPLPNFRAFSAGFPGEPLDPSQPCWHTAAGGFTPGGNRTRSAVDNTVFWIMIDFLKRRSLATFGFVDLVDPHRMPDRGILDPRLGPYDGASAPGTARVDFDWLIEPAPSDRPAGTSVVAEFRAASAVDPDPWRWRALGAVPELRPDAINFPLDPLKACDAHVRKYDDRTGPGGTPRDEFTHFYNRRVTRYTTDIRDLKDPDFLAQFGTRAEPFGPRDVRYVNWRLIFHNAADRRPPRTPAIDTFALVYRYR